MRNPGKVSKQQSNYRLAESVSRSCKACDFFLYDTTGGTNHACQKVEGLIDADFTSDLFKPQQDIQNGKMVDFEPGALVNPLKGGFSKAAISSNISELVRSGRPQNIAVAAALSNATREFRNRHPNRSLPKHLRRSNPSSNGATRIKVNPGPPICPSCRLDIGGEIPIGKVTCDGCGAELRVEERQVMVNPEGENGEGDGLDVIPGSGIDEQFGKSVVTGAGIATGALVITLLAHGMGRGKKKNPSDHRGFYILDTGNKEWVKVKGRPILKDRFPSLDLFAFTQRVGSRNIWLAAEGRTGVIIARARGLLGARPPTQADIVEDVEEEVERKGGESAFAKSVIDSLALMKGKGIDTSPRHQNPQQPQAEQERRRRLSGRAGSGNPQFQHHVDEGEDWAVKGQQRDDAKSIGPLRGTNLGREDFLRGLRTAPAPELPSRIKVALEVGVTAKQVQTALRSRSVPVAKKLVEVGIRKVSNDYYVTVLGGGKVVERRKVKGRPVLQSEFPSLDLFLQGSGDRGWVVNDAKTGFTMARGEIRKKAIASMKETIESRGVEFIESLVEQAIKTHGLTPRYEKKQAASGNPKFQHHVDEGEPWAVKAHQRGKPAKKRARPGRDVRTRKGIYYFPTFASARDFARDNDYPTDRINEFTIGWAIQLRVSGPYVGPPGVEKQEVDVKIAKPDVGTIDRPLAFDLDRMGAGRLVWRENGVWFMRTEREGPTRVSGLNLLEAIDERLAAGTLKPLGQVQTQAEARRDFAAKVARSQAGRPATVKASTAKSEREAQDAGKPTAEKRKGLPVGKWTKVAQWTRLSGVKQELYIRPTTEKEFTDIGTGSNNRLQGAEGQKVTTGNIRNTKEGIRREFPGRDFPEIGYVGVAVTNESFMTLQLQKKPPDDFGELHIAALNQMKFNIDPIFRGDNEVLELVGADGVLQDLLTKNTSRREGLKATHQLARDAVKLARDEEKAATQRHTREEAEQATLRTTQERAKSDATGRLGKTQGLPMTIGNTQKFAAMLNIVWVSAARKESRPVLMGVVFEKQGTTLDIASADGFRLSRGGVSIKDNGPDFRILVPATAIKKWAKFKPSKLEGKEASVSFVPVGKVVKEKEHKDAGFEPGSFGRRGRARTIEVETGNVLTHPGISITVNGKTLTEEPVLGTFPNYTQLIPASHTWGMQVDRDKLLDILKQLKPIALRANGIIRFKVDAASKELIVSARVSLEEITESPFLAEQTDEQILETSTPAQARSRLKDRQIVRTVDAEGNKAFKIPAVFNGEYGGQRIAFNITLLLEMVDKIYRKGQVVNMKATRHDAPGLFVDSDIDEIVLMPMFVQD